MYTSFKSCHLSILESIIVDGLERLDFMIQAGDRIPLNVVGYGSNRWIQYTDNYLYGGKPFNDFLSKKFTSRSVDTFIFGGNSNHARGECLLSLSVNDKVAHLNFRTMHWCGAGVLDLNLAWLISKRLNLPVWITCPKVTVYDWQLVGYKWLEDLTVHGPLLESAVKLANKPIQDVKFERMKRKIVSLDFPESMDEEIVVSNFPRITPQDLSKYVGLSGPKLRNYLRKHFGYTTKGENRNSHSWHTYEDPRFISLCDNFGIVIAGLPPIEELAKIRTNEEAHEDLL